MPTLRLNRLLLAVLGLLLAASSAQAWWDNAWPLRKKITIDTSATGVQIADTIGPVPVLLRLHDGNFTFANAAQDGSDLRFVMEDDKTVLPYHFEKFDPVLDEAFVWVKIPDLKPGVKTNLWLYYGNGKPAAPAAEPKATYDNDTVLVYHFGEHGTPAVDASGHGNNSTAAGTPSDGAIIGTGLRLDGHTPLTIPGSDSLNWIEGPSATIAAWVKFGAPQPAATLLSRRDGAKAFALVVDRNTLLVEVETDAGVQRSPWAAPVTANSWHHVAVVTNGTGTTIYVDGETYTTMPFSLPALSGPMVIGADAPNSAGGRAKFVGEIDELEISKLARTASFLKFAAVGQGGSDTAAKLLVFGDEEQPKSWLSWLKGGYIGIIIDSLSVDGWVVIGILMVMMLISWIVMIGKAQYLNRVAKGNSEFLKEWRHVASDLSALDSADGDKAKSLGGRVDTKMLRIVHAAPLYRLYHVGVEEIQHRLNSDRTAGTRILSARSIQAIRASLDGTLVRETQRLSSQMVLLTIAISGGPFLGLLGTVVGVMITFAAVAAAGDVNVNAIAPGIAAALAATVAGLAVAIPSLFGYNYLLTRVKAATSDMHVFIDEFVAKMAEFYSEPVDATRGATRAPFTSTTH